MHGVWSTIYDALWNVCVAAMFCLGLVSANEDRLFTATHPDLPEHASDVVSLLCYRHQVVFYVREASVASVLLCCEHFMRDKLDACLLR